MAGTHKESLMIRTSLVTCLLFHFITCNAFAQRSTVPTPIDLVASSEEEKAEFIAEDKRRVTLLRNYENGFDYNAFCKAWDFSDDGHIGLRGFAKSGDVIEVYLGRNLDAMGHAQELGSPTVGSFFGNRLMRSMGECADYPSIEHDVGFKTTELIGCVLRFENLALVGNRCTDVSLISEIEAIE